MQTAIDIWTAPTYAFEEENAVCYIGGYVVEKLKGHPNCSDYKPNEMMHQMRTVHQQFGWMP